MLATRPVRRIFPSHRKTGKQIRVKAVKRSESYQRKGKCRSRKAIIELITADSTMRKIALTFWQLPKEQRIQNWIDTAKVLRPMLGEMPRRCEVIRAGKKIAAF